MTIKREDLAELDDLIRIPPFHNWLGVRVVHAGDARCVLEVPANDAFVGNPLIPAIHGGIISALVDLAGGAVLFMDLKYPTPTVDMRLDFIRPAIANRALRAVAVVKRRGKRVAFVDVSVFQPPNGERQFAGPGNTEAEPGRRRGDVSVFQPPADAAAFENGLQGVPEDARLVAEGRCVYSVNVEAGGARDDAERYPIG